ncbi:MAG TPA: ABC transporter substrate-binding protein [Alphaproteobacteria bacterium]|nr:ABC transporter substrate-binding protein [Alphaproteobacteria bacterium]
MKTSFKPTRRTVLKGATAGAALGTLGFPGLLRAQAAPVKLGVLHPVSGIFSYSGTQSRAGAMMAIDEINAAGGIKSMGGAKLQPLLADAQSKPDVGAAEVEKLNEAGAAAIVGPYASAIAIATTQAAARHNLPHVVDVGTADQVVTRGLTNTFRFSPGVSTIVNFGIDSLVRINDAAGKPAKTVFIVHEESAFGTNTAKVLNEELPKQGFQVLETVKHANPTRDFSNIVLRIQAAKPDLLIPANYYDEYVLLTRTLQQQRVAVKGVYSILGGGASSYKFVKEFPDAAAYVMDCNHWFDPRKSAALALKAKTEKQGLFFSYEVFLNYNAVMYLADALERAKSVEHDALNASLASSTWDKHILPYGPTKFVNGQNTGAKPAITQVLDHDIKVIYPNEFASGNAVFPVPARKT